MNVLLLTTHFNIGGITSYIKNLAIALKKQGHRVIVASSGGDMTGELQKEGIEHVALNVRTKSELNLKLWLNLPKVLRLLKKENIGMIHSHTRVTQVLGWACSRLSGVPYITTCHGFFKARFFRKIFKCWGDKTIAISDAVKSHLVNDFGVEPCNISLIYNGIDTSKFKKTFTEDEKDILRKRLGLKKGRVIGAIGRLSSVKGNEYLIEAFKALLDKYKDLNLIIVGNGPEEQSLRNLSNRLGTEEHVKFHESCHDTLKLLSIMDIFVSSSTQEGLGLSLIEAMASGKPVVATDVGGVASVVKHNLTGLMAKPRDSMALIRAISQLLDDSVLMKKLAKAGEDYIEEFFTIKGMTEKVEDIIKAIEKPHEKKRILIVGVNWLGDVLFTTPFIKAIRKKYPASYIACMVVPRCKDVLADNPNLDEVALYDEDGQHKSLFSKIRLIMNLRRERFDIAFVLHRSFTKAFLVFLSGAKSRIGYDTKKRSFLLTGALDEPDPWIHKIEYFLKIAGSCGANIDDKDYEFFVIDNEKAKVNRFLKSRGVEEDDLLVVLNPGGNWLPKRWPADKFAALACRLTDELKAKVVITGAPKDSKLAKSIMSMSDSRPIDATGSTSIKSLGALMKRADLVISSDSGPMHLALSVKSSVIALFGPTSEVLTGPYGSGDYTVIRKDIKCAVPCYDFSCKKYRCMEAITVDEVYEKAREILGVTCRDSGILARNAWLSPGRGQKPE